MTNARPETSTRAGAVRGSTEHGLAVFRGIPFARPPFGPLRFAAPVPRDSWEGVREATAFGPPPPQTALVGDPSPGSPGAAEIPPVSPDCLTVNVWSPDLSGGRPVMVWIYGGGYLVGDAGQPGYDAAVLASNGVVVVTFNHRVGVEGFAQLDGAPANRGLLDQVAALRWVRDNIRAFGGDPGRVTVFGESAGAGSIAALLAMPSASGLFGRAILQSVPGTYFTPALGHEIARTIGAELDLPPTAEAFAERTPAQLATATQAVIAKMATLEKRWGKVARTITPFSPIVDGEVLPRSPWLALEDGSALDVELIVGFTQHEYQIFLVMDGTYHGADDEQSTRVLRALGPEGDAVASYHRAYPDAKAGELIETVFSDWLFRMPTLRLAQHQVASGGQAHVYELCFASPAAGGAFGAHHGLDVPLVFGDFSGTRNAARFGTHPSAEALALSDLMRRSWTDFAATGDPGWPDYRPGERLARVFDAVSEVVADPEKISRVLWEQHDFDTLDVVD